VAQFSTLSAGQRDAIRHRIEGLNYTPLISVAMPVYNPDASFLRQAIESVRSQLYPHWEFCIADDCSTAPHVRQILEEFAAKDDRIKVSFRRSNGHISAASNTALGLASGEFVALLDHDDELTEHALYMVAEELNANPEADLVYSDEDKINPQGELYGPHFKTDWNPDLLYSLNFISHLGVYRRRLLEKIGGFRSGYEGSQDYDLALRVIEQISEQQIRHIPHVLYHWRESLASVGYKIEAKAYAHENARHALRSHFENTKKGVDVVPGHFIFHRAVYPVPDPPPLVTLIVVAQDDSSICFDSLLAIVRETNYAQLELIVLGNLNQSSAALERLSTEPRIKLQHGESTSDSSALINKAVSAAQGKIIGVLAPDLKPLSAGWLTEMVSHACRPEIGVVGAKVYDVNGLIHHAGVILGIHVIAGMAHRGAPKESEGYVFRTHVTQNLSAVSGGCLLFRREVFEETGGFDEVQLPDLFRDVDLCLRIRERGYRVLWTPFAELQKTTTASPPSPPEPNAAADYMKSKWGNILLSDPYYNPNLTREREDFSLAFPPRVSWGSCAESV
jgi:GT2 family glycosyltransferase